MPDFSRVLCAIDFSASSRRVLDCALWWARAHGADVSVLHVHQMAVPTVDGGALHADPSRVETVPPAGGLPALTPEEHSDRQLEVERFVDQGDTDGLQIETLLDEDPDVAAAIVARADALAADVVVVGAGASTRGEHPGVGGVAAGVLRDAPCSVLLIPAPASSVANPCATGITRILCAVSLEDDSTDVLACAASLADEATAHLAVVHVVELSEVAALAYDFDAHREARVQPACESLVDLVGSVVGRDKPVEEIVAQGKPATEVIKLAAEESPELIVIGRGAGGMRVATSIGHLIAREARCPVLFVQPDTSRAEVAATRDRVGHRRSRARSRRARL
jgi:nucleotide-binding universal stress UspA family protein